MIKTEQAKTGKLRINSSRSTLPSKPSLNVACLDKANVKHVSVSFPPGTDVKGRLPVIMKAIVSQLCEKIGIEPYNIGIKGYGLSSPQTPHLHMLVFIRKNRSTGSSWRTCTKESVTALETWFKTNLEADFKATHFFNLGGWIEYIDGPRNLSCKKVDWIGFDIPTFNEKIITASIDKMANLTKMEKSPCQVCSH